MPCAIPVCVWEELVRELWQGNSNSTLNSRFITIEVSSTMAIQTRPQVVDMNTRVRVCLSIDQDLKSMQV